jgi:hypothetical protein
MDVHKDCYSAINLTQQCGPYRRETVAMHRQQILLRLRAGTMPCDGAWPDEKVALFERWALEVA